MPTLLHSDYYALRTTGQVLELIQVLLATPTPVDCYGDYDFSAAWLSPPQTAGDSIPGHTRSDGRARSGTLAGTGKRRPLAFLYMRSENPLGKNANKALSTSLGPGTERGPNCKFAVGKMLAGTGKSTP